MNNFHMFLFLCPLYFFDWNRTECNCLGQHSISYDLLLNHLFLYIIQIYIVYSWSIRLQKSVDLINHSFFTEFVPRSWLVENAILLVICHLKTNEVLILFTGGSAPLHAGLHPPGPEAGTPPRAGTYQEQTPPKPGIPPGADPHPQDQRQAPPRSRHPPKQAPPRTRCRHPTQAGTPRSRHPPGAGPPLRNRHPPGAGTPSWSRHHPPPPCSACWEIRATSRRYASFWNPILF